ncbi:hypothetical protein KAR10_07700, partial [bacterium]|nr:hypothetical protein [bacterium]
NNGNTLWAANGRVICNEVNDQRIPRMITDQTGGAIIVWSDERSGDFDIYAQRVDNNGNTLWAANGRVICSKANDQGVPLLIADQAGGAIIVWPDKRSGDSDIYAQRVDNNGNTLWATNGRVICNEANDQIYPGIIADPAGGAIIVWQDKRTGDSDIYAQRVDNNGNTLWTANGCIICNEANDQIYPDIIADQAGGAIITWNDKRDGNYDIYGQRVDNNGNTLWADNGRIIYNSNNTTMWLVSNLVADQSGGAIIVWQDNPNGDYNIYGQRMDGSGHALWAANGCVICCAVNDQTSPQLIEDAAGGAIITWQDKRLDAAFGDIYAQRIDKNSSLLWGNGLLICNAIYAQFGCRLISNQAGGAILVWIDQRDLMTSYNIYCQKLIRPCPVINNINPPHAPWGKITKNVTFTGHFFQDDRGEVSYLKLTRTSEADIPALNLNITSSTALTCDFDLSSAELGNWFIAAYDSTGNTVSTSAMTFTVFTPQMQELEWISVTSNQLYTGSQDNLVGQINCTASGYDFLQSWKVQNMGTAAAGTDISSLFLWYQPNGGSSGITFDPHLAQKLDCCSAIPGEKIWQLALQHEIYDGDALYITADLSGGAQVGNTLRFLLPPGNASFLYGNTLPSHALVALIEQTIMPSTSLHLDLVSLSSVNVTRSQNGVNLARIRMINVSGKSLVIKSLLMTLVDKSGNKLDLPSVFKTLWILGSNSILATLSHSSSGQITFNFAPPITLSPQGQALLELRGNIQAAPSTAQFKIGFWDGQCVNNNELLAMSAAGNVFPLLTHPVNIRKSTLAAVFSNYPNPFQVKKEKTRISYYLKSQACVKIGVLSLTGELVKVIEDGEKIIGVHETEWDGRNQNGHWVISGIYLLRIQLRYADGTKEQRISKIAVVK